MSLSILLLFIMAFATSGKCATYTCDSRKPCVLKDVFLVSETDLKQAMFPNISDPLTIASGRIPHFTRELATSLANIVDLTMNNLQCETVFIRPEMTHIEANDNRIHTILVESDEKRVYELLSLNLTNNQLTDVAVFERFSKLRGLNINANHLERLTMDTFSRMKELRQLSLAKNLLHSIETYNSFQLLKLDYLSLAGNKLTELNMEKWDLPSLVHLDLSGNSLYIMSGGLYQYGKLQVANVAGNYWKCEYLINMTRGSQVKFDADPIGRCVREGMPEERHICCNLDASSYLTGPEDLGLFNDKWEELHDLKRTIQQLNETWSRSREKTSSEMASKTSSLEDRLIAMEKEQKKLLERLEAKESQVAIDEIAELRTVTADHKYSIQHLEDKQSELNGELEDFVERLNGLRELVDKKSTAMAEFSEEMASLKRTLERLSSTDTSMSNRIPRLEGSIKQLEGQQLKCHLFSIDLKSQIDVERKRIHELQQRFTNESERLGNEIGRVYKNFQIVSEILDEISTTDD